MSWWRGSCVTKEPLPCVMGAQITEHLCMLTCQLVSGRGQVRLSLPPFPLLAPCSTLTGEVAEPSQRLPVINVTIREEEATEADSCDPISIPLCDDETVFSCPATMDEAIALGACTQTDKSHQVHTWLEPVCVYCHRQGS